MSNELKRLWESTEALFERFDIAPDWNEQMRVLFEEVFEFTVAAQESYRDTLDEAADVIVTVLSSLMSMYVDYDNPGYESPSYADLAAAIDRVIAKNDAKQPGVTHEYTGGKIRRISK